MATPTNLSAIAAPTAARTSGPGARRKTRVVSLQVLYEADSVGHDVEHTLRNRTEDAGLSGSSVEFAKDLVHGVLANRKKIDKIVSGFAPSWPIDQMAIVDRNILRIAVFEIVIGKTSPPKVVPATMYPPSAVCWTDETMAIRTPSMVLGFSVQAGSRDPFASSLIR